MSIEVLTIATTTSSRDVEVQNFSGYPLPHQESIKSCEEILLHIRNQIVELNLQ
jgi:hypothetical protein